MRAMIVAAALHSAVASAASGGLSCNVEDQSVKLAGRKRRHARHGRPVFNFRGQLEILDAASCSSDLRNAEFDAGARAPVLARPAGPEVAALPLSATATSPHRLRSSWPSRRRRATTRESATALQAHRVRHDRRHEQRRQDPQLARRDHCFVERRLQTGGQDKAHCVQPRYRSRRNRRLREPKARRWPSVSHIIELIAPFPGRRSSTSLASAKRAASTMPSW